MPQTFIGRCTHCNKQCYTSRKEAKTDSKRVDPTAHWSVYRCGPYWHFGHMPDDVLEGKRARSAFDKNYGRTSVVLHPTRD